MATTYMPLSHPSGASCCRILMLLLAVLCAIGGASAWMLVKPTYTVSAAMRFDPVVSNIVTGQKDRGGISDFTSFLATQAKIVTGPKVAAKVANDLAGQGLKFFEKRRRTFGKKTGLGQNENDAIPRLEGVLKKAVLDETITAETPRRGELIIVSMRWTHAEEAKKIVDSFVRNYVAFVTDAASDGGEQPRRISSTQKADITQIREVRGHYTIVLLFGFLGFGILSILLQGRASDPPEQP